MGSTNRIMQVRIIILPYHMGREAYSIRMHYQIKFEGKSRSKYKKLKIKASSERRKMRISLVSIDYYRRTRTKSKRRIDKEGKDNKKVNTKERQAINIANYSRKTTPTNRQK